MFSDQEKEAFNASINAVSAKVQSGLAGCVGRWSKVEFVKVLHRSLDASQSKAFDSGVKVACAPGCSSCCKNARVEVFEHEARLIAQRVAGAPVLDRARWLSKLEVHKENGGVEKGSPCAFLEDSGLCGVYDVRPSRCRKAHSLDAEACAEKSPSVPQSLLLSMNAEALILGTAKGYAAAGEDARAYELCKSVLAAWAARQVQGSVLGENSSA